MASDVFTRVPTMITFLRLPDVLRHRGDKKSSTYQAIADGLFTPPIKIGPRASAWPDHEVEAIARARIAGKTEDEIRALVARLVAARSEGDNAR